VSASETLRGRNTFDNFDSKVFSELLLFVYFAERDKVQQLSFNDLKLQITKSKKIEQKQKDIYINFITNYIK
jgi:hypothetical protein